MGRSSPPPLGLPPPPPRGRAAKGSRAAGASWLPWTPLRRGAWATCWRRSPSGPAALGCRRRVFLGRVELRGSATLGEVGAEGGSELALVVSEASRIAACSANLVRIWSVGSGECLRTLAGHQGIVYSAVFALDGLAMLTISADQTAKIWSATSWECLHTLEGHRGDVMSAAFSPDGRGVLTVSWDQAGKIWSVASGACLCTLEGHMGVVRTGVFSPDGQRALTASSDGTANIWSSASGGCLHALRGHRSSVMSAVFSPSGREALTASWDCTAKLWSSASGQCLRTLEGHRGRVDAATFSPDGRSASLGRVHSCSRRGPSRTIQDHRATRSTRETDKCTENGRPSDGKVGRC
ncbi:unnamed protein product [Prorocentrum cordatum]|uniref:Uncharacterized protein n=2 Tax=Prorocentrum cordatum TaxID=2364126 RepID=A0ABN9RWS5_9DINO|nr:unnamed protein product [Polarella glacialis]